MHLFRRRPRPARAERTYLRTRAPRGVTAWGPADHLVVWLGVLLVLGVLAGLLHHLHFHRNPQYVLRRLTIVTGTTMNEMLVREYLGLHEGMPLFDLDIERRRQDLLSDAPNIRSITITRRLPSRMEVRIVEREPVGRVGRSGQVIDSEGVIFPRYVGVDHLPVLTGLEGIEVQPGARLDGLGLAAVHLLAALTRPELSLPVATVDLSHPDYLQLSLADQRLVKLCWKGMETSSVEARNALVRRLQKLLAAMAVAPQRRVWDATVADESRIFSPY